MDATRISILMFSVYFAYILRIFSIPLFANPKGKVRVKKSEQQLQCAMGDYSLYTAAQILLVLVK